MATTTREAMNSMTYGVELETKGLSNRQAAAVVQSVVGGRIELGHDSYESVYVVMDDGRKWRCMNDASLGRGSVHSEVVTPIMRYTDMDALQNVTRALRTAGARVDSDCGIHVHVGAAGLEAKNLGNLAALVYGREELITSALGTAGRRIASFCKPISIDTVKKLKKSKTMASANVAWYGRQNLAPMHYDGTRYHGLNLHNVWFRGTVEFRWFDGSLHAGLVRAYVCLCLALVATAKAAKGAAVKKAEMNLGDARWTMYRFLYHKLGLTGDEFKNVRDHLTKKLPGSIRGGNKTSDQPGGTRTPSQPEAAAVEAEARAA